MPALLPPGPGDAGQVLLLLLPPGILATMPRQEPGERCEPEVLTCHTMVLDMVVRVLRLLGCPHACGEKPVWPSAEFLRGQSISLLTR